MEGGIDVGVETTIVGFCNKGERSRSIPNTTRKREFIAKEQKRRSEDKNYQEEMSEVKKDGQITRNNRILAEDTPGRSDITWGMMDDEEPNCILRMIRYGTWGF